jgi:hypothetical protein
VHWVAIILIGALVGYLGGMFGKGGSALATPLLAAAGVPAIVAVASPLPATVPGTLVAYRRYRHLGQHKLSAAEFVGSGTPECVAREIFETGPGALGMRGYLMLEFLRPIALDKIIPVIEQQDARLIQVPAYPNRCMQRCRQAIAGGECFLDALLEREHGLEPKLAKERIPRGEPVVERPDRRSQPLGDRRDGRSYRSALCHKDESRVEKIGMVEHRAAHRSRMYVLELTVNII